MLQRVSVVAFLMVVFCASAGQPLRADSPFLTQLRDRLPFRQLLPDKSDASAQSAAEPAASPSGSARTTRSDLLRASSLTEATPPPAQESLPQPASDSNAGSVRLSIWNKLPSRQRAVAPTAAETPLAPVQASAAPGRSSLTTQLVEPAEWTIPTEVSNPVLPLPDVLASPADGDSPQIAAPLFGEVLEDASRPAGIVQSGWDVEDWIEDRDWINEEDFEPPEWLFWKNDSPRSGFWRRLLGFGPRDPWIDVGIGRERVRFGTFEIDPSQPWNNVRVRYDSVYSLPTPDRIQYFWAKSGTGPDSDGEVVDYQEFRIYSEVGGTSASVITEYPIRSVDPLVAGNTTGFGDMVVGNKAVMVDGRDWQITQVFRTYINTGSVKKGLGNGHVSMEPGVLARYEWTEDTYVHGEFKFWFPVGAADMAFAGQVLRYGIGLTHVGYDNDVFAVIHDFEFVGMTFLDGLKTKGGDVDVDGETVGTWLYGMHFVLGPAGDLGLFEVGLAAGVGTGVDWYDGLFRLDFRWNY